jgi:hypothetical protein
MGHSRQRFYGGRDICLRTLNSINNLSVSDVLLNPTYSDPGLG